MSYAPNCLIALRNYIQSKTGLDPASLGIVGDPAHGNEGYHVGWDRLQNGYGEADYSWGESPRDMVKSDAAMGFDIGNFTRLRELSSWLVSQCEAGAPGTQDIREIIYSPDGYRIERWDRLGIRDTGDSSHLWHTHLSYFRGSEGRDKTQIFRQFFGDNTMALEGYDRYAEDSILYMLYTSLATDADQITSVHVVDGSQRAWPNRLKQRLLQIIADTAILKTSVAEIKAKVDALAAPQPVTLTDAQLAQLAGLMKPMVKAAVAEVLREGADAQ